MKDAPESDYNRCTGVFKPLAGENILRIYDNHAETEAAATREVVAQLCEIQTDKKLEQSQLISSGRGARGCNLQ